MTVGGWRARMKLRGAGRDNVRALGSVAAGLAIALAGSLGNPGAVKSAVGYQIVTDPTQPVIGQVATVEVATFWYGSGSSGASPQPLPMADFLWEFVADAPSGMRHVIALTPRAGSGNEWSASFTFDELGEWEIGLHPRHLGSPPDASLGARRKVVVVAGSSDRPSITSSVFPAALAAAITLAAFGGAWLLRRRARTHGD